MDLANKIAELKPKMKVGLLGGSFNPAHEGHLHISKLALKNLGLDYVIWLVSPQNPLKILDIKNTLDNRLKQAKSLAANNKIIVSDIEKHFSSTYTYNTIRELKKLYPEVKFYWLMGADNMVQFSQWQNWQDIIKNVQLCVFDRDDFAQTALSSEVAQKYKGKIVKEGEPCEGDFDWLYFMLEKHPMSSTQIRNQSYN